MRQNKYRGKSLDNKEWFYGQLLVNKSGTYIITEEDFKEISDQIQINGYVKVDPTTVGEYMNYFGVEFYDGDIFNILCDCGSEFGCSHDGNTFIVKWSKESAAFVLGDTQNDRKYSLYGFREENMRVIGNIHDNLINGEFLVYPNGPIEKVRLV